MGVDLSGKRPCRGQHRVQVEPNFAQERHIGADPVTTMTLSTSDTCCSTPEVRVRRVGLCGDRLGDG
jgi:hypothetical protein